jgi:hypothetical protein
MAQRSYAFDRNLLLSDGLTAVTASGVALIGGVTTNSILDLGNARADFTIVADISAMTLGATNQYRLILQGSNSATFASGIQNLMAISLGNTAVNDGGAQTSTTGRYEIAGTNEQADVVYRYVRLYLQAIGTSLTAAAFIAMNAGD